MRQKQSKIDKIRRIGVILAAGKGTRFETQGINKTAEKLNGKPLVKYGTDLFSQIADMTIVVVGAYAESVIKAVGDDPKVIYGYQGDRQGTGAAAADAVKEMIRQNYNPEVVWIGNGDHMMFYTPQITLDLKHQLDQTGADLALVTFDYEQENRFGRIIRKADGLVEKIVEYKDATEEIRKVKEVNAGFYCFKFEFLQEAILALKPSPVSGEYYITDLVGMAAEKGLGVAAVKVPFEYAGIGVNTRAELAENEKLVDKSG